MRRVACLGVLVAAVALSRASSLAGQIGELHLGVVASHGTPGAFGPGAGLVVGIAPGRLVYVGARWSYQFGSTQAQVRTRVQSFAADLGVQIPAGPVEVVPSLSLGALRYAQRGAGSTAHSIEFLAAPGLSVEVPLARIALIPELQFYFAGKPDNLPVPVTHRGLLTSLRLVVPIEVSRFRW
ncbi:MAG TPA: hypothetical protein VFP39_06315 [Gemmatimonadales bacterium]|nr:hypothetical protein [Gemmatimonadales bacterium]